MLRIMFYLSFIYPSYMFRISFAFVSVRLWCVFQFVLGVSEHEVEAVEDVGFGGAAVEVKEQQVEVWVKAFYAFFYSFGYYVVGYTSEGLQADDVIDSALG